MQGEVENSRSQRASLEDFPDVIGHRDMQRVLVEDVLLVMVALPKVRSGVWINVDCLGRPLDSERAATTWASLRQGNNLPSS